MTKNYALLPGTYKEFNYGQKVYGLHLNRLVRDILRDNGYPTQSCDGCAEPNICDLLTDCGVGGGGDWNTLLNRPQSLLDIAGVTGVTGDILYFNGTNWVALAIGSNDQVLTVAGGLPAWAAGGASDYISLSDTPGVYGVEDVVPTVNTTTDGLDHNSNNIFFVETSFDYANVLPISGTSGFTIVPEGATVFGNRAIGRTGGEMTADATGTITFRVSLDNTGAKYAGQKPIFDVVIVDLDSDNEIIPTRAVVAGSGGNTVEYSFPATNLLEYEYRVQTIVTV